MARRLFTLLSALSLLLCVATAVLWVRSYRRGDVVRYVPRDFYDEGYFLFSTRGRIWFHHFRTVDGWQEADLRPRGVGRESWDVAAEPWYIPPEGRLGFYARREHRPTGVSDDLVVPHYAVALALLVAPVSAA